LQVQGGIDSWLRTWLWRECGLLLSGALTGSKTWIIQDLAPTFQVEIFTICSLPLWEVEPIHFDRRIQKRRATEVRSAGYCPGGRYRTVFLAAWSISSVVRRTVVFERTAPLAFTARDTAAHAT